MEVFFFLFVLAEMSVLSHRLTVLYFFCCTNHVADGTMAAAL